MDIMNVLRTGMNMSISGIHIWLCNTHTDTDTLTIRFSIR